MGLSGPAVSPDSDHVTVASRTQASEPNSSSLWFRVWTDTKGKRVNAGWMTTWLVKTNTI